MEKDGTMSTKAKIKDTSKVKPTGEELVFTEKEKCKDCKDKELTVKLPNYTREEMENAMLMIQKYSLTRQEQEYLVNLNNRVNNDNKMVGCGKCMVQVKKNIQNAWRRLYA